MAEPQRILLVGDLHLKTPSARAAADTRPAPTHVAGFHSPALARTNGATGPPHGNWGRRSRAAAKINVKLGLGVRGTVGAKYRDT